MTLKNRIILSLFSVVAIVFFSGCGTQTQSTYKIKLEVWGLFDESAVYADLIEKYKTFNPYIEDIKYRKFTPDTYKQDLLEALASGQGPDIFLIGNNWLPSFENKLAPVTGAITTEQEMRSNFVGVVFDDFMSNGQMYGAPLSVDSLALYYNKDMLNAVGIPLPPKTWAELNEAVKKITRINATGDIVQSGVAMGTAKNVNRPMDIFTLLMMQNGIELPKVANQRITLDQGIIGANGQTVQAGADALGYYTNFAKLTLSPGNVPNPLATWNFRMHNSIDAFNEGSTAMMLNYSWQAATIKNQNPKLNFGVAPVPQINVSKPVNIANYWAYAVAKNKMDVTVDANGKSIVAPMVTAKNDARIHEAWQFLKYLTMKNNGSLHLVNALTKTSKDFPITIDPALEYLKKTQKPTARLDIIEMQKADPVLSPFASGNLIAKSWYKADQDAIDSILADTIDSVVRGDVSIPDALKLASTRISVINAGRGN